MESEIGSFFWQNGLPVNIKSARLRNALANLLTWVTLHVAGTQIPLSNRKLCWRASKPLQIKNYQNFLWLWFQKLDLHVSPFQTIALNGVTEWVWSMIDGAILAVDNAYFICLIWSVLEIKAFFEKPKLSNTPIENAWR